MYQQQVEKMTVNGLIAQNIQEIEEWKKTMENSRSRKQKEMCEVFIDRLTADNEYLTVLGTKTQEVVSKIDLMAKIDKALEEKDQDRFIELTSLLKELEEDN